MSRHVILGVAPVAALLSFSVAHAADLSIPYNPPAAVAAFDWTGPYAGASVGIDAGTDHDDFAPRPPAADTFGLTGFNAGVYGGWNWQQGDLVYGVEGDLNWTNLSGSHEFSAFDGDVTGTLKLTTDWQGSLVGRAGYVMDGFLFYGLAGFTAAHATLSATGLSLEEPFNVSDSKTHLGGTIGVGAEYALTESLIARGELRYTSFANQTYDMGADLDASSTNARWDQLTASVGLGMKF